MANKIVKDILSDSKIPEVRKGIDTIKVWEAYRDEAQLWRALCLLQIPATIVSIIFALIIWLNRHTTINVPPRPAPGIYTVGEIPDVIFVENAQEFINLVASYQPSTARNQFIEARKLLTEPMLTDFSDKMLSQEIQIIETTNRTQFFFPDPTKTQIIRNKNSIVVQFEGERVKILSGKQLPSQLSQYKITMVTVPRNRLSPHGIAITKASFKDLENVK